MSKSEKQAFQFRENRLKTFIEGPRGSSAGAASGWRHADLTPDHLADCGFYFTPTKTYPDQITCFWCGKKERGLKGVKSISQHHLKNSKSCPYSLITSNLESFVKDSKKDTFWERLAENNAPKSVIQPHSKASVALRHSTFKDSWHWDSRTDTQVTSTHLAEAGFYHAPVKPGDDRVICMYCDCPLADWDLGDIPLEEHKKNSFEYCYFLESEPLAQESPSQIDKTPTRHSSPEAGSGLLNDSPTDIMRNSTPKGSPPTPAPKEPEHELDAFDFSIEELRSDDKGTIFQEKEFPPKRLTRKRKQELTRLRKEKEQSTSLVLNVSEAKPEPNPTDAESDASPKNATTSVSKDLSSDVSNSEFTKTVESVDEEYTESFASPPNRSKKDVRKRSKETPPAKKKQKSQFSDDDFGLNEADIDRILNSPKKSRKMKTIQKSTPAPQGIFNISDQNLGDYDAENLSFIENDVNHGMSSPAKAEILKDLSKFESPIKVDVPHTEKEKLKASDSLLGKESTPDLPPVAAVPSGSSPVGEEKVTNQLTKLRVNDSLETAPVTEEPADATEPESIVAEDIQIAASAQSSPKPEAVSDQRSMVHSTPVPSDPIEVDSPREASEEKKSSDDVVPAKEIQQADTDAGIDNDDMQIDSPSFDNGASASPIVHPSDHPHSPGDVETEAEEANVEQPSLSLQSSPQVNKPIDAIDAESTPTPGESRVEENPSSPSKSPGPSQPKSPALSYAEYVREMKDMETDFVDATMEERQDSPAKEPVQEDNEEQSRTGTEAAEKAVTEATAAVEKLSAQHEPSFPTKQSAEDAPTGKDDEPSVLGNSDVETSHLISMDRFQNAEVSMEIGNDSDGKSPTILGDEEKNEISNMAATSKPSSPKRAESHSPDKESPERHQPQALTPRNSSEKLDVSFGDIEASTPQGLTRVENNTLLKPLSMEYALNQIAALEETISYLAGVSSSRYELHDDVEGQVTEFIAAMPEEEEDMTIEEWMHHNASTCRKTITELTENIIGNYAAEFDRIIQHVSGMETVD